MKAKEPVRQNKNELLSTTVKHIDIKKYDVVGLVEAMGETAFQGRNLGRAAQIYNMMLTDKDCAIILCLAGSLFSAGLKNVVLELINNNMIDAIVSTGAIIVDQDFFEGLGFKHYRGSAALDDNSLRDMGIDRIYDTLINEDELRICDNIIGKIANELEARPYSSREFIKEMGAYLDRNGKNKESVVLAAYKKNVPIFVPAFSDCSAGFGLVMHQSEHPTKHLSLDSAKDFLELTKIKIASKESGLFMVGGGVPKNFAQDTVVAAELLGQEAPMHKYAIQITVADERDGALSGSTLREASSWGKVSTSYEQMVYSEATIAMPLIVGYAYGKGAWKNRTSKEFSKIFTSLP
ncbi:MAG: deoxyhypusine synthase [Bdellovibrionales bacterium RBG_16_40_8]|nr:MAG: deoxyhypusine synthase [Bdellovibrionales bacterium RBG_16_40_8]